MKPILTSLFLIFICCNSFGQFYNGYTGTLPTISNPTNASSAPFLLNATRTDTMVVSGTGLGSSYFGQMRGQDTLHPFVVYYNNSTGGGVQLENCAYMKVIAIGGNRTQSGGGVPLVITGHADFIQASGFVILNGSAGAIWCKTEAADACKYPNPIQWLYPVHMRNIWITNCRVGNADGTGFSSGDAFYLGSTGSKGDRQVPCLGNALIKPMYMSGVHALYDTVYQCRRSAIQISGADSGFNEIKYCQIYNVGSEYCYLIAHPPYTTQDSIAALSQGAGIRTGFGDGNNVEIAYNHVVKTFLYNLDIETGTNVHDNYVDSSGFYGTCRSPQQIQNVQCYAIQPNAVLKLQYNISGGHSTQPQSISFNISGSNNFSTTGNVVCGNVGKLQVVQPFTYATTCSGQDTTCHDSTYTIIHDSLVLGHFDSTFRDSVGKVFHPIKPARVSYKFKHIHIIYVGDSVDTVYHVLVRPAYDSAYICSLCTPPHDTTVCVRTFPTTTYGVFILQGYNGLVSNPTKIHYAKSTMGLRAMRYNYTVGATYQNQTFLDSNITVTMTYNTADVSVGNPHPFPTNIVQVQKTQDSLFSISKPYTASWLNEPATFAYWDTTGGAAANAATYLAGFNSFISTCHAHNVLATDGGLTFSIVYSLADYYTRIGRADSVTWLTSKTGIFNFSNTPAKIYLRDFYNALLTGIRSGAADYVQLHWYEPISVGQDTNTVSGVLPVVIGYIQNQTLKKAVTFETGTGNNSLSLFNGMFTEWKQNQTDFITYFLGSGVQSVPNETYYINFVVNNP